jgi:large subunit ribosomal protein L37Ae
MVKQGVRSGASLRKISSAISKLKKSRYVCPQCGKKSVKRISYSQWMCKSCKSVFAGGAYTATTSAGEAAKDFIEKYKKG